MKLVSALTDADKKALTHLHTDGPTHRQRQRAQAVLLSAKGYTLEQIADVLDAHRNTVSGWLNAWQGQGLGGLADAPSPAAAARSTPHWKRSCATCSRTRRPT